MIKGCYIPSFIQNKKYITRIKVNKNSDIIIKESKYVNDFKVISNYPSDITMKLCEICEFDIGTYLIKPCLHLSCEECWLYDTLIDKCHKCESDIKSITNIQYNEKIDERLVTSLYENIELEVGGKYNKFIKCYDNIDDALKEFDFYIIKIHGLIIKKKTINYIIDFISQDINKSEVSENQIIL